MHRLILIRHAKSSWDTPALGDFERPLNTRGLSNAPLMGRVLRERGIMPDLLLASPATRAATTATLLAGELGYESDAIAHEPRLYDASLETLVDIVQALDNRNRCVALVAHNPGLSELGHYLCGPVAPGLPTCAILGIELAVDLWQAVCRDTGTQAFYEYPRKHTD